MVEVGINTNLGSDGMAAALRLRAGPRRRGVQPAAHGRANEEGAGDDTSDADVPHRLHVVLGEAEPVYQGADAQQNHAVPVRPLRSSRVVDCHSWNRNTIAMLPSFCYRFLINCSA